MVRVVVGLTLAAGKGHAVVGGSDHDGILGEAELVEGLEDSSEMPIVMLDLHRIVEHVVADGLVVGPEGGNLVDVGKLLPCLHAASVFIPAMGLHGSEPEGPGSVFRCLCEELVEIRGVVDSGNRSGGWRRLLVREADSRQPPVFPILVFGGSRPPAFACVTDRIAVFGEGFHPALELGRKKFM